MTTNYRPIDGAFGRKRRKIDAFARRLDNAKRNVDGRPPQSLIDKREREAEKAARQAFRAEVHQIITDAIYVEPTAATFH